MQWVTPMIDAAIVGLGRWGKAIVESVQGKSGRLRFVRGVCQKPDQLASFAATHGFEVGSDFAAAIADGPAVSTSPITRSMHTSSVSAITTSCTKPIVCARLA